MTTPVCTVHVQLNEPDGAPIIGAKVIAQLSVPEVYDGVVVPTEEHAETDSAGVCTLNLFPNALGQMGSRYSLKIKREGLQATWLYAVIPNQPEADLHDHLVARGTPTQAISSAVRRVNGQTGDVSLDATDIHVGDDNTPTIAERLAADNTALAAAIAAIYVAMAALQPWQFKVSDYCTAGESAGDQSVGLAFVENLAYLAATTGGYGRAELIFDGMFWHSSPFRLRDRVQQRALGRAGCGLSKLPDFTGQASLVKICIEQHPLVHLTQTSTFIELDGRSVGLFRLSGRVTAGQTTLTGISTANGHVPVEGNPVRGPSFDVPTFIAGPVTGGPGNYSFLISSPAAYDNFNLGDPTRDSLVMTSFKGRGPARTCTADITTKWVSVSNPSGAFVGDMVVSNKFGANSRIAEIDIPGSRWRLNKVPIQNGTGPLGTFFAPDGAVVEFADETIEGYDGNNKTTRAEFIGCFSHHHAGWAVRNCGDRSGTRGRDVRTVNNGLGGVNATSSDMRWVGPESGENFGPNYDQNGATPRPEDGELYSGNDPAEPALKLAGSDEHIVLNMDITGEVDVNGTNKPDAQLPGCNIIGVNFQMSKSSIHPDDDFLSCQIRTRGNMRATLVGCTAKSDQQMRFFHVRPPGGTGTIDAQTLVMETANGQPLTLWFENFSNTMQATHLDVSDPYTGQHTHGHRYSGYNSRKDGLAIDPSLVGGNTQNRKLKAGAVSLVTNPVPAALAVCTVSCDTGSWSASGDVIFIGAGAQNPGGFPGAEISFNSSASIVDDDSSAYDFTTQAYSTPTTGRLYKLRIPDYRFEVPAGTTASLMLVARMATSAGSVTVYGNLNATRLG